MFRVIGGETPTRKTVTTSLLHVVASRYCAIGSAQKAAHSYPTKNPESNHHPMSL